MTTTQIESLIARAAMLANLEGIGTGCNQLTVTELQSLGADMLTVLEDGEEIDRY